MLASSGRYVAPREAYTITILVGRSICTVAVVLSAPEYAVLAALGFFQSTAVPRRLPDLG